MYWVSEFDWLNSLLYVITVKKYFGCIDRPNTRVKVLDKGITRACVSKDLLSGRKAGRLSDKQISYSERGNIQGAQFFAVAGKVYETATTRGLGTEIPTKWFLQDIRD